MNTTATTATITAELERVARDAVSFPGRCGAWFVPAADYDLPAEVERVRVAVRKGAGVWTVRVDAVGSGWSDDDQDLIPVPLAAAEATLTLAGDLSSRPVRTSVQILI
ncbi:hypothetical protein [Mycolicibacterium fallax]|uniref:Uncharacterized protein n=1 Tax=Mycolicibacterium fallax TaxID=1793 RepID=A0A1X1RK27_MYCFA|nr:hypothetical protein [Mycolicibacterium fallax]ORV08042.1 hypothetical protein AWC04_02535 [Mycolicibacterium fallax]